MKYLVLVALSTVLFSCGIKVPLTNELKEEYDLNEKNMKKVQFFTSQTIILEKSKTSGTQGTSQDGTLISSKSKEQDRVIIPANTKCIFESAGANEELVVRFEVGVGKTLKFGVRAAQATGKYYLIADWKMNQGGEMLYGNEKFSTAATSGNAYLMVKKKNLNKTKRKDRIVKGMKV
jgi:hypothetical protein